jgi:hypothetical protein
MPLPIADCNELVGGLCPLLQSDFLPALTIFDSRNKNPNGMRYGRP